MKAREFLNMPAVINMEIMCARIELEHYKRLAGQMQNTLVDNDRTRLLLLNANEKIREQEKLLEEKYISLTNAERKICEAVNRLDDEHVKAALKYRYICLMKFEEISEKMQYCVRQVRRFCEKGMAELDEIWEEKTG